MREPSPFRIQALAFGVILLFLAASWIVAKVVGTTAEAAGGIMLLTIIACAMVSSFTSEMRRRPPH